MLKIIKLSLSLLLISEVRSGYIPNGGGDYDYHGVDSQGVDQHATVDIPVNDLAAIEISAVPAGFNGHGRIVDGDIDPHEFHHLTQDGHSPIVREVKVPIVKTTVVKIDKPVPVPVEKVVHIPIEKEVHVKVDNPVHVDKVVEIPVYKKVYEKVPYEKTLYVPVVVKTIRHHKESSANKECWFCWKW